MEVRIACQHGGELGLGLVVEDMTRNSVCFSICKLICMYEDIVTYPGGSRNMPPPGICAEYGYMLLIPENAEIFAKHATSMQKRTFNSSDYATFFPERGKELMLREIELYPESAKFIAPLIERLCK